jgi:phosphatidyl-myo-inositol dimannoside synthase
MMDGIAKPNSPPTVVAPPQRSQPIRTVRRLLTVGHSYAVGMNRRLAHEMSRVGGERWEVVAAAPRFFAGNDLRPVHLATTGNEPCPVIPLNSYFTRRVHLFIYGRGLKSLLADAWDVVHCWEEPYILAGGQLAWWTRPDAALVFRTAQSLNKFYPPPFEQVEQYAMGRAAGWICSGSLVANTLTARTGYDKPMARIPLGVDLQAFRPDRAAATAVMQSLGWAAPGPPVIGYLGRFVAEKGLTLLTRALDQVAGDWRALFVGAGPLLPRLQTWAAKHGDRVRLCTEVTHEQVPAYLNAMSVLCAPSQTTSSWKEQFGRMIVEAFAAGVPVIGSTSGEIPFVLNGDGVVVGETDVAGWATAIRKLLDSPDQRCELARRGLQRAADEFAWPVVARKHLEFFDRLLESPRR